MKPEQSPANIDDYISQFPENVKEILQRIRKVIAENAPGAVETISYQMPTFKYKRNLIHFAAFEKHIGLYPTPVAVEEFVEKLSAYKTGKGSVQFPLNQPIPYDLIADIVKYRVEQEKLRK